MSIATCTEIDPLVTPYVDGEIDAAARAALEAHLRVCAPCHSRVAAERAVHDLLRARKDALQTPCASAALRARCAKLATDAVPVSAAGTGRVLLAWRHAATYARPAAIAASLVLLVGGAFVYELTEQSATVMAAELTADHVKCFGLVNPMMGGGQQTPEVVEGSLASIFGWPLRLPPQPDRAGLELVGARPCLYGEGRIAHIMYRHHGTPVSVFMLPKTTRREEVIEVLGHKAAIWSVDNRTFVLVAREALGEVEQLATFVHASLH